ncbi:sigma-70 family RNA polymerase sigma factor [Bacteroides sp. AN502]|nr:sigma-70 family RNA polymerase sigma factor [Caecibacteroides pullorum]MDC6279839.1 sigma-70 family RNA polymerase sigma factor [Caecibacteroides pullorum]
MRTDRKELFRVRFEQHYPRLCSIAYGYVSDYDESEDIVQELFIYIWDKGKDCLPEQELTAYLTTAVKNRCISFLRRKKEDTVSIEDYPLADHHLADETADSSENRRSPEEVLEEALSTLPPKCKDVFLMTAIGAIVLSILVNCK